MFDVAAHYMVSNIFHVGSTNKRQNTKTKKMFIKSKTLGG